MAFVLGSLGWPPNLCLGQPLLQEALCLCWGSPGRRLDPHPHTTSPGFLSTA